jgi:hypothetical protein
LPHCQLLPSLLAPFERFVTIVDRWKPQLEVVRRWSQPRATTTPRPVLQVNSHGTIEATGRPADSGRQDPVTCEREEDPVRVEGGRPACVAMCADAEHVAIGHVK